MGQIIEMPIASQAWLDAQHISDPDLLLAHTKEAVLAAIQDVRNRRLDVYFGSDSRARDQLLMHAIDLVVKYVDSTLTPTEAATFSALRDLAPMVRAFEGVCADLRTATMAATGYEALATIVALLSELDTWPA